MSEVGEGWEEVEHDGYGEREERLNQLPNGESLESFQDVQYFLDTGYHLSSVDPQKIEGCPQGYERCPWGNKRWGEIGCCMSLFHLVVCREKSKPRVKRDSCALGVTCKQRKEARTHHTVSWG